MEGNYCYKYPRPAVTTDCVVCSVTNHKFEVLLVKRANELGVALRHAPERVFSHH